MREDAVLEIAQVLRARNQLDAQIAKIIERPMTAGHLGEWIAAQVFDIELAPTATAPAFDGWFRSGPLQGRSVNVKWYLKREGLLDMTTSEALDEYLVMAGPAGGAVSSHGQARPWRIDSVHLFEARTLVADQLARGNAIGTASSIRAEVWTQAEIYPNPINGRLPLGDHQVEVLRTFRPA